MNSSIFMSPLLAFSFFLFYSAAAFNITTMLEKHSDFSTFNNLLAQTKIADDINTLETITVLVVDNGAISTLSGKSNEVIKRIMTVHILLDYYNIVKLKDLANNKSAILTTFFQSSGIAINHQGFLNASVPNSGGDVKLGSAAPGSDLSSTVIKSVEEKPYNISILQISGVIIPPGIDNATTVHAPPPKKDHAPSKAPSPAKASSPSNTKAPSPATSKSKAPSPATSKSKAPSPAKALSPSKGPSPSPKAHAPTPSSRKAKSPSSSPKPSADMPAPSAGGPASSEGGLSPSPTAVTDSASAKHTTMGTCLGILMGVMCMAAL